MLGTYALSAGYYDAYYLKAQKVRTLIKADFDALWAQGFDALVAPTSPTVAFRVRRAAGRPGRDVPVGRLHAAGQHGRAAGHLRSRAGCPTGLPVGLQLIGAPWSEAALLRAGARLRGDHRRRADWRGLEPADLARRRPATPTPAERLASLAGTTA